MRLVTLAELPQGVGPEAPCSSCEHPAKDHRIDVALSVSGNMVCPYYSDTDSLDQRCVGHLGEDGQYVATNCLCPNYSPVVVP